MFAYLSLGSNIGEKKANIENAITKIKNNVGNVITTSSFYKSESWGFDSNNFFINNVIRIETNLTPIELLSYLQKIENEIGRKRNSKGYSDRIIDIDILFYEDLILETDNLKIPHPLLQNRNFVLFPLNEIAKELIHPHIKKSIFTLKNKCKDTSLCEIIC